MITIKKMHCADDDTLEYIADLEQRNAKLEQTICENNANWEMLVGKLYTRCQALALSARKSAEEAEKLKASLLFYATEENYKASLVAPDLVLIPVCDDRGEIARRVLQNG